MQLRPPCWPRWTVWKRNDYPSSINPSFTFSVHRPPCCILAKRRMPSSIAARFSVRCSKSIHPYDACMHASQLTCAHTFMQSQLSCNLLVRASLCRPCLLLLGARGQRLLPHPATQPLNLTVDGSHALLPPLQKLPQQFAISIDVRVRGQPGSQRRVCGQHAVTQVHKAGQLLACLVSSACVAASCKSACPCVQATSGDHLLTVPHL